MATLQGASDSCQAQARQLEETLRKREGEIQDGDLRHQEACAAAPSRCLPRGTKS